MYRYQTQTKFNAHKKQTNRMIKKQTQTFNAHNKQKIVLSTSKL